MSRKRLFYALAALALVVAAALAIRVSVATSAVALIGPTEYDEEERGRANFDAVKAGDSSIDLSDYALRHPELMHPAAPDLSDWYLRHRAEISRMVQPDLSDYALRHPELTRAAAPDLSDWYLRHRADFER